MSRRGIFAEPLGLWNRPQWHTAFSQGSGQFHETYRKLPKSPQFPNTHKCSPPQMEDDAEVSRCILHLSAIYKSYNRAKAKYLLLEKTLEGGSDSLDAVHSFREDQRILTTFRETATAILQGHLTKSRYNTCLGLLAARLMYL